METRTILGVMAGVLAGAAVGAGAALIFAPQAGRKTRAEIQKRAGEMKARADDLINDIKAKDEAFIKAVKEGADNYRREMMAKIS